MNRNKRTTKTKKPRQIGALDPEMFVEELVEQEIEFVCPKRGKVKQKVLVKKLRPVTVEDVKTVFIEDVVLNIEKQVEEEELEDEHESEE